MMNITQVHRDQYANGYGVSVITGGYGSEDRPYELAVLHDGEVCYRSGLTTDVEGYLTMGDVIRFCMAIAGLPRNDECSHTWPKSGL